MEIREVQRQDDLQIEALIRSCLKEYDADKPGCAWSDPDLGRFSEIYQGENKKYWVAVDNDRVVAGCGIGPLPIEGICELQKMYAYPQYRGKGISQQLMDKALRFAKQHYQKCYLETFANMVPAIRFYQKYGFIALTQPLFESDHYACDRWFILTL